MNEWMSEWIIYKLKSLVSRQRHLSIQTYRQTNIQTDNQTNHQTDLKTDKHLSSYSLTSLLSHLLFPSSPALSLPLTLLRFPFQSTSSPSLSSPFLTPPHYTTPFPASNCTLPPSTPPTLPPSLPFADLPFYFCTHSNINTIVLEHSTTTHTGDQ